MRTGRILTIGLISVMVLGMFSGCIYERQAPEVFFQHPNRPVSGTEYRVLPPDTFQVTSMHVPEIQGGHRLMPDGTVTFPLLGRIYLANLTPQEIEDKLKQEALKYYEQVDATVTVTNYASQKFYVFSEGGGRPHPWTGRDTLLDAIAPFSNSLSAWQERVTVIRVCQPAAGGYVTPKESWKYRIWGIHPDREDKPRYKMVVNVKAMWQHGDMANNILLKPDDIVYMRPHPFAWFAQQVRIITMPLQPILEVVRIPYTVENSIDPNRSRNNRNDN